VQTGLRRQVPAQGRDGLENFDSDHAVLGVEVQDNVITLIVGELSDIANTDGSSHNASLLAISTKLEVAGSVIHPGKDESIVRA